MLLVCVSAKYMKKQVVTVQRKQNTVALKNKYIYECVF